MAQRKMKKYPFCEERCLGNTDIASVKDTPKVQPYVQPVVQPLIQPGVPLVLMGSHFNMAWMSMAMGNLTKKENTVF